MYYNRFMKIGVFGLKEVEKQQKFQDSLSDHQVVFIDQDLNEDQIPSQIDFDIISVFVQSKITKKVVDTFPNLKMVAVRSTGFDNIDLNYAKEKNITVTNVPAYGSHTVAEFTFGLILSLSRKIPQAVDKVKAEGDFDNSGLKGFDLYGKTIGVIGTGKIGLNVIKIASGFGMKILAYDVNQNEEHAKSLGFEYVELDNLLKNADVVSIHVPSNPKTHHLINQQNIFEMKKGALLINTSRGDIVETEALYQAISKEHLRGAGLDVLEAENELGEDPTKEEFEPTIMKEILEDSQLIKNPNVIVTPHSAFYTIEAEQAITQTTIDNILGFIKGSPINIV